MATRKYDLLVLSDPAGSEEDQTKLIEQIEETITKHGGSIDERDVWGKRRLAYPVKKRRDGLYTRIRFEAPGNTELLPELELYLRYKDEILRYLVTKAVVGKSKGDPSRLEQVEGTRYSAGPRPDRRPGPPRPERRDESQAPAPAATATETADAAPAPAAVDAVDAAPAATATAEPEAKPAADTDTVTEADTAGETPVGEAENKE